VAFKSDARTSDAVKAMDDYIMTETLAESMDYVPTGDYDYTKDWDIDGAEVTIFIKRTTK